MKQNIEVLSLYSQKGATSRGEETDRHLARAIITWPRGLSTRPEIYPLGDTFEQSLEIQQLLEELFGNGKASRQG